MKKVLVLFLSIISVITANAQKIVSNDLQNGVRSVSTSFENVRAGFSDKMVMYVDMSYMQSSENPGTFFIGVKLTAGEVIKFMDGGRLLLKTTNGDVITLTNYGGSIASDIKNISGVNVWETQAIFKVTPEQIAQISSGISKVRVELLEGKMWDKEYKKDKIGSMIAKEYSLLQNAIKTNPIESFTEGF